jgi:hypothetical protein
MHKNKLGLAEFENFLMAYDVIGQASQDLALLDTYDTLMFKRCVEKFGQFGDHEGMDYLGR